MDKRSIAVYAVFLFIILLWTSLIFIPPIAALNGDEELAYGFYSFHSGFCHQILNRSYCIFSDGTVGDCITDNTVVGERFALTGRPHYVEIDGLKGWELGVCSRDVAIYLGILIGAVVYPFFRKLDDTRVPPAIFYVIALIPIALDGGTQIIGWRESTNFLRLVTGFIAGFPIAFYLMPMFNISLLKK